VNTQPKDHLVEQPAIRLPAEPGWITVPALKKTFGATGTWLSETKGRVVLMSRLRAALARLNPVLPPEVINAGLETAREQFAIITQDVNK
jgi:hypothetical protein